MSFVAYSPLAGGFFVRDVGIFKEGADGEAGGRWDKETTMGAIYHRMYSRPKIVEALGVWEDISRESGVSKVCNFITLYSFCSVVISLKMSLGC